MTCSNTIIATLINIYSFVSFSPVFQEYIYPESVINVTELEQLDTVSGKLVKSKHAVVKDSVEDQELTVPSVHQTRILHS